MSDLTVWRLCRSKYADDAFNGEGAKLYGGRWTMPGIAAVYCAESRSLAALEILANIEDWGDFDGIEWSMRAATFPASFVETPTRFPAQWRRYPHTPETQRFGSIWVKEARSVALRVPSAITPGEFNYLLNPEHPDFAKLTLGRPEPFHFDPRLL
jgi:RES domain-containing protein